MIEFARSLSEQKVELLKYFRDRAAESLEEIRNIYGIQEFRERAIAINKAIKQSEDIIVQNLMQEAKNSDWDNARILDSLLMVNYTRNVVMLESRNEVWPYDYMSFSRRIGEMWEPFCKLCFYCPTREVKLFIPPLFSEVKEKLHREIEDYIDQLGIAHNQKLELKQYYQKVWALVVSGEIKLELDLHFQTDQEKVNVDFKSGFGSNEKGNTNRLLMVATIYKSLGEDYNCTILVRSQEDKNNHYFQTLKNSGVWNAYCGDEAYNKIADYTGFNLKEWISKNTDWYNDLKQETVNYLRTNHLDGYLSW
jgi:hypothetical protein